MLTIWAGSGVRSGPTSVVLVLFFVHWPGPELDTKWNFILCESLIPVFFPISSPYLFVVFFQSFVRIGAEVGSEIVNFVLFLYFIPDLALHLPYLLEVPLT